MHKQPQENGLRPRSAWSRGAGKLTYLGDSSGVLRFMGFVSDCARLVAQRFSRGFMMDRSAA